MNIFMLDLCYQLVMFGIVLLSILFLLPYANLQVSESDQQCTDSAASCQHMGVCEMHEASDGTTLELCNCQRQFSGKNCEFANSVCTYSCKHGSVCEVDGCGCTNTSLYSGKDCGEVHCIVNGKITENFCKNGGVCYKGECVCPNNTRGTHCELIACGAHTCLEGYCSLDKCLCDTPCTIGCDISTGLCKSESDGFGESGGLSTKSKVLAGTIAGVVALVIIPALYAMYNMSIENAERNRRLRSALRFEQMTQAAYLEKEQEHKAIADVKSKTREEKKEEKKEEKEERKQRKSAKQKAKESLQEADNDVMVEEPAVLEKQSSDHSASPSQPNSRKNTGGDQSESGPTRKSSKGSSIDQNTDAAKHKSSKKTSKHKADKTKASKAKDKSPQHMDAIQENDDKSATGSHTQMANAKKEKKVSRKSSKKK